jgi:DnaJ-class molecular chaperone
VRVTVEVPARLSRAVREKLEALAAVAGDDAYPQRQGFLDRAKRFFRH